MTWNVSTLLSTKFAYGLVISVLCLVPTGILVSCSPPHHPIPRQWPQTVPADQLILEMKDNLGLTDEQEANIRPIIEAQVRKREELTKEYWGGKRKDFESLKYDLKDLRISTESRLQYFLTEEQMIKYGDMEREEDERISGSKPPHEGIQKPHRNGGGRRLGNFSK
jgi:hypothetical protein